MQTLSDIDTAIAELQEARIALIKARDVDMKTKVAAFVFEYDWSATWPHPAQCCIERKLSADCIARIEAFVKEHGKDYVPKGFIGGMTYSILVDAAGNKYVTGGGGSVIVKFNNDGHYLTSFNPQPIAEEIYQALQRGEVPFDIRKP